VIVPKLAEIKSRREELGFNQKQLATLCKIRPSLLNMFEKGNANPSYNNLVTIFDVLEEESEKRIEKLITAGKICTKTLTVVNRFDYVDDVIRIMKSKGFSQVPVIDSGGCAGLVTEHSILNFIKKNGTKELSKERAKNVMEIAPPIVDWNQKITPRILEMLYDAKCILVYDAGKIRGIITKIDAIRGVKK